MKTNKNILVAGIAITTIVALGIGSTSAMNGQGTGEQAKRGISELITAEQRIEVENMTQEDRKEFIQNMRAQNGLTTDRVSNRDGDSKRSEAKKGNKSEVGQFITEAKKNELRDMTQDERHEFIQKIRAENGLDTQEMGEGNKKKRGSKGNSQSRNK